MFDWNLEMHKAPKSDEPMPGRALMLSTPGVEDYDHSRVFDGLQTLNYEIVVLRKAKEFRALKQMCLMNPEAADLKRMRSILNSFDLVFGDILSMSAAFKILGKNAKDITFPDCLLPYLGRNMVVTKIFNALNIIKRENHPYYIKPYRAKEYPTMLVYPLAESLCEFELWHMNRLEDPCYISEPLEFLIEYRCPVLNHRLQDIRQYAWVDGYFNMAMNARPSLPKIIEMIEIYQQNGAPEAYVIDVAVTMYGQTVLVECNDGQSFGSYGLDPVIYAKMHIARYREVISQ